MTISPISSSYDMYYGRSTGYENTPSRPAGTAETTGRLPDGRDKDWQEKAGIKDAMDEDRKEKADMKYDRDEDWKEKAGINGRDKDRKEKAGMKDGRDKDWKEKAGIEDPQEECQTCKNRKYKDGSDEMVSFKSPRHVSPESAASAVRAHEQEHVSNAYKKAAMDNGKVIAASVSIHMAICPECGRTYVSGGTTHTQIKYYNEENPYQQDLKKGDQTKYAGMNMDYAV